jgi:hypothetical protein
MILRYVLPTQISEASIKIQIGDSSAYVYIARSGSVFPYFPERTNGDLSNELHGPSRCEPVGGSSSGITGSIECETSAGAGAGAVC